MLIRTLGLNAESNILCRLYRTVNKPVKLKTSLVMRNRCKTLLRDHAVPEVTLRLAQGTIKSQPYLRHSQFKDLKDLPDIQDHPLRIEDIDNIQIHLLNTFGQPMNFKEGTNSTVVLHFHHRENDMKMRSEEKQLKEVM